MTIEPGPGLPFDPGAALEHLRAKDKVLGRLIDRVGPYGLQVEALQSPYEALGRSILYQQLSGKAAATILGRLNDRHGGGGFPAPPVLLTATEEALREVGVSRSKALALRDLADKTQSGLVPSLDELHAMEEEAIVERLTAIRGVGRWTVEMLLIFRLGRPDVLPVGDYGIRKGFGRTFARRKGDDELPAPADVARRGARWRPYRTVASWYLWRATELDALP